MSTLMLADGTTLKLKGTAVTSWLYTNGENLKAVTLTVVGSTLDEVKSLLGNEDKVSTFTVIEDGVGSQAYSGYQVLKRITIDDADVTSEEETYSVTLALTSNIHDLINAWESKLKDNESSINDIQKTVNEAVTNTEKSVDSLSTSVDEMDETLTTVTSDVKELKGKSVDEMTLDEVKEYKINESKSLLADYLASHPITSTAHAGTAAKYSVTSEKQQYIMSMIAIADAAEAAGVPYQPSWNAAGEACTYDWTVDELKQLALEIANYVRPLVSKQQTMESKINDLTDIASVIAYAISFE